MATVGGGAAYQRLTKPEDGLSESFQYWGGLKAKRNAEAQARREQRKKEADDEFKNKYNIDPDKYTIDPSEFRNADVVGREAMSQVRDQLYETRNKLKEDPNNVELQKQWDKLNASAKYLQQGHQKYIDLGKEMLKKEEANGISGLDSKWRERLEAYDAGRIKVRIENGEIMYDFFDEDGKFKEAIQYRDLVQGTIRDKVDLNKETTEFLSLIGAVKYDEDTGGFVKSIDTWGEEQDAQSERIVDAVLESKDYRDDVLFQAGLIDDSDHFDDNTKDKLARMYLKDYVKGAYEQTTSLKPYNRPQPRSYNKSFGERKWEKKGSDLYNVSMRISSGDKEALGQVLGTRLKVQDGDKTVEKIISDYAITDDQIVFLDNQGNELSVIDRDADKRKTGLQVAMLIQNGQSADEVQSLFEYGEKESGGQYNIGELSDTYDKSEGSVLDLKPIEDLPVDEDDAVLILEDNYSDAGFYFGSSIPFSDQVSITAPNGISRRFKTTDKNGIKEFIAKYSEKQNKYNIKEKNTEEPKKEATKKKATTSVNMG